MSVSECVRLEYVPGESDVWYECEMQENWKRVVSRQIMIVRPDDTRVNNDIPDVTD